MDFSYFFPFREERRETGEMLEVVSVLLHPACLCNLLFHVSSLHRQPQRQ